MFMLGIVAFQKIFLCKQFFSLCVQTEKLEVEEMMEKRRAQESECAQDCLVRQDDTEMIITRKLPDLIPGAHVRLPFTGQQDIY